MPENDTQTDFKSQLKKKPHNIIINNNRQEQTAKPNTGCGQARAVTASPAQAM